MEQPPARWQLELRRDALEVRVPADGGDARARFRYPAVGRDLDLAARDLDAGARLAGQARDELVAAVHRDPAELGAGRHREPVAAHHGSADAIRYGVTLAVEVEPPAAHELEPIRRGVGVAAALGHEAQRRAGLEREGRQRPPFVGKLRLLGIDAGRALDRHLAQARPRIEDPFLAVVPRPIGSWQRERLDRTGQPRFALDEPGAGPHLHAQLSVRVDPRRDRRRERHRHGAFGQRAPEHDLARRARDLEPDPRLDAQRNLIDDAAKDVDLEPALVARLRGRGAV